MNLPVTDLVMSARNGEKQAWDELVERYAPLIWSICRRYRLVGADAEDVGQMVWLHLVDQLDNLRDPAALPGGWPPPPGGNVSGSCRPPARLPQATGPLTDTDNMPDPEAVCAEHELLLAERNAALREAFCDLPPGCQQLMTLLTADPPVPYAEISARLGIPVGSIGPSRSRCLARLRRHPAIAVFFDAGAQTIGPITVSSQV